jgi:hypothetical protein
MEADMIANAMLAASIHREARVAELLMAEPGRRWRSG